MSTLKHNHPLAAWAVIRGDLFPIVWTDSHAVVVQVDHSALESIEGLGSTFEPRLKSKGYRLLTDGGLQGVYLVMVAAAHITKCLTSEDGEDLLRLSSDCEHAEHLIG